MSFLTAVLLGLVQGVTEFLPISSSGHMALLYHILQIPEADLQFDILLHLGTMLSVLFACWRELRGAVRGLLGLVGIGPDRGRTTRKNAQRRKLALFLILGSIPLLLGWPLQRLAETIYGNMALVSVMLLLTGGVLYVSDRLSAGTKGLQEAGAWSAVAVGLAQVAAVIPGLSRMGLTVSAGMLCGVKRSQAVRFSLLLSVPAVLGAAAVSLVELHGAGLPADMLPKYLCGMAAAAVSGYLSIRLIRYLAARSGFGGFAYYCWGAGLIALLLSLIA